MKTTIRDVARAAGVSVATVSYVLNQGPRPVSAALRARVLDAVRELEYQPLGAERKRLRTLAVGIVVPHASHPFFADAIGGATRVLQQEGHVVFASSSENEPVRERQLIQALLRRRVDGLILTTCGGVSPLIEQASRNGVSVVIMDRDGGSSSVSRVTINNYQSSFQAVRLLWETGHTQIGLINGPDSIDTARERVRGYTEALAFVGQPLRPELLRLGPFTFEHGLQATRALLALADPPTAIFSSSAVLTAGVLWGVRERRLRIPDDVAVVGFGDPVWASLVTPPLTVIEQPTARLGEVVARLLLGSRGGDRSGSGQHVVLEPRLVLRESHWRVAQARASGAVGAASIS